MKQKYRLSELKNIDLVINKPCLIFLRGDLGAGKTTLAKHIINDILGVSASVISPTYTYYNKYEDITHFDLYRLTSYDEFFSIGGEEVLENNAGVIIVEWPEKIEAHYKPDIDIRLSSTQGEDERELEIVYTTSQG